MSIIATGFRRVDCISPTESFKITGIKNNRLYIPKGEYMAFLIDQYYKTKKWGYANGALVIACSHLVTVKKQESIGLAAISGGKAELSCVHESHDKEFVYFPVTLFDYAEDIVKLDPQAYVTWYHTHHYDGIQSIEDLSCPIIMDNQPLLVTPNFVVAFNTTKNFSCVGDKTIIEDHFISDNFKFKVFSKQALREIDLSNLGIIL